MMSSVSPLHPIGKLVNPGASTTFYGLDSSSVHVEKPPSSTVNCIGISLSPSSSTTSSLSSSLSSSTVVNTLTTTTVTSNPILNLINCSTPLPSSSPSSTTTDTSGHNIGINCTNNTSNEGKTDGKDPLKPNVPYTWRREKINGSIVYISPSNCLLWSHQDISVYLLTEGTCKCGLECPIILEDLFNFDPRSPSIKLTPDSNQTTNCNHLDKSLNSKADDDHTLNHFPNNNPINAEYPPKTCNHRRRNLTESSEHYLSDHHQSTDSNSDVNFSTPNTTSTLTPLTVNDTRNQINRIAHQPSPIPEVTNQHFTDPNHVHHSPAFQQKQQQQLTVNSIPLYRNTQQSIVNSGVSIFKSDANYNLTQVKEASSSYSNDHQLNIPKDFHNNQSPLTTNSYINWLPLNASDDNRLTAIVNDNQSNAFANASSSSLPGFADVISGINLTPTLIDPHNPGAGQLVQLYNPVQYTSVPPNAVALLSPAQNLNRDGSATILIPSLMQPTDHHHHHHHHQHQQPQPIVLNSSENVSALDHQSRNLLPSLGSTSFSSIPLQTPYTFQTQISHPYSTASSPSPTQSYTVTPTSITNNSASNEGTSDNSTRDEIKSKAKAKLIKRRSPRSRKVKENNQRLNQTLNSYINRKPEDSDHKLDDDIQVIGNKQTVNESPSRIRLIGDGLIDELSNDGDDEPMESQECDYGENQFISQSGDDKGNFEYERIDDSAQCTSEDIMRELSSHHNSTIRNVGVQSDELIGEPESSVKLHTSVGCSDQMMFNNNNAMAKSFIGKEEEEDETVEEEEDDNIDDDYSIHSNLPDDSEESSEKDDQINSLKTTCEFVLHEDDDSFNELEGNNYHDDDDDDEFGIDGNTNDNDLLSSDDLSVHFVNSDNNNNISFEDADDDDDDDEYDDNYENQNGLISMTTSISMSPISKQPDLHHSSNALDNYAEEEEIDNNNTNISSTINPSSISTKPPDEGLYERLSNSNSNKVTVTQKEEDREKNRNNKRLERLRKELRCYENNFDQTTAQSPPLSPQVRTFETGDLVWGQMRGNPSWPGKLVSNEDVPGSNNGQAERGKVWVRWFGDNLVTQVELDKLKTLSEGLEAHHTARKKHRKGKKMDSCLDQAIQEAMMELDKQMEQQSLSSSSTTKSHQQSTSSPSPPQQPPPAPASSSSSSSS